MILKVSRRESGGARPRCSASGETGRSGPCPRSSRVFGQDLSAAYSCHLCCLGSRRPRPSPSRGCCGTPNPVMA